MTEPTPTPAFHFPTDALLAHWQGHRRVTRRMIQAFPETELFHFSVGGMRPFAALAVEMLTMAASGVRGLATGRWAIEREDMHPAVAAPPTTRAELLGMWDEVTDQIDAAWPGIPSQRFEEVDTAFGQWTGVLYGILLYWIDNEIHHRGQGYVYLRALGIEPPAFYDRS